MPKGVEHAWFLEREKGPPRVPTSVMPKGVEHAILDSHPTVPRRADLCDAERR